MSDSDLHAAALRALSCLDLTNLNEDCTTADIDTLCGRALNRNGHVAAICIWPGFVAQAQRRLANTPVKIATVVNFPEGNHPVGEVTDMTAKAVADGADEIDMVIPWGLLMEGHPENVPARVARVKAAADGRRVKAIIESGMLAEPDLIAEATRGALDGGADFVKTSTGKVPVNATPQAAETILTTMKARDSRAGFKVAGGVKSTETAMEYLALADRIMGEGWAGPDTFRFGASGLLDALIATLEGGPSKTAPEGY